MSSSAIAGTPSGKRSAIPSCFVPADKSIYRAPEHYAGTKGYRSHRSVDCCSARSLAKTVYLIIIVVESYHITICDSYSISPTRSPKSNIPNLLSCLMRVWQLVLLLYIEALCVSGWYLYKDFSICNRKVTLLERESPYAVSGQLEGQRDSKRPPE